MSKTLKIIVPSVISLIIATIVIVYKIPAKDAVFTDQSGREVRIEDFKGKVVLMNFIYTSCPNKGCELMTLQFLRAQELLKNRVGKDLFLLSVSLDPAKDTPETLKQYAAKFKADPKGWLFLSSSPETADRVSKMYGVIWKTDADGKRHHKIVMALLNKNGEKTAVYDDVSYEATGKIEADIRKLLD